MRANNYRYGPTELEAFTMMPFIAHPGGLTRTELFERYKFSATNAAKGVSRLVGRKWLSSENAEQGTRTQSAVRFAATTEFWADTEQAVSKVRTELPDDKLRIYGKAIVGLLESAELLPESEEYQDHDAYYKGAPFLLAAEHDVHEITSGKWLEGPEGFGLLMYADAAMQLEPGLPREP